MYKATITKRTICEPIRSYIFSFFKLTSLRQGRRRKDSKLLVSCLGCLIVTMG